MSRRSLPLAKVCGLLEPGSAALLTAARGGRANVMTLSCHAMMEFEPPLVGCIVSDRKHSFRALKATRE
jgi:flavin reductase (DIM6/NTAB) family NADH-FMN oxidoreductase RutF